MCSTLIPKDEIKIKMTTESARILSAMSGEARQNFAKQANQLSIEKIKKPKLIKISFGLLFQIIT